jgi:hypothetical protein
MFNLVKGIVYIIWAHTVSAIAISLPVLFVVWLVM